MATLLQVGSTIINLDTVTAIELNAGPSTAAIPDDELLVRIHFTAPAIHHWTDAPPTPAVPGQTLELGGAEAALLWTYLAYEAVNIADAMAEA